MSIFTKLLFGFASSPQNVQFHIRNCTSLVRYATATPSLRAYEELSHISPGVFRMPKEPFEMEIEFLDSSPYVKKKRTVVALHGSPGYCQHFETMVNDFNQSADDVRFISLSLPDFRHTRQNGYFWHTIPEKVNFVRQLLSDLKIDTIDSFVCHSFGVQTVVDLWQQPEGLDIKSICCFAPQPFWDTELINNRKRARKLFLFNNQVWYRFLDLLNIVNYHDQPAVFQNTNELLLFYSLLYDQTAIDFERRFRKVLSTTETPVSVIYGAREKVVSRRSIERFNGLLGLEMSKVVKLNPKIHTEKDVIDSGERINSYLLENAGHMLHMKHHSIAKRMLMNLLAKV